MAFVMQFAVWLLVLAQSHNSVERNICIVSNRYVVFLAPYPATLNSFPLNF